MFILAASKGAHAFLKYNFLEILFKSINVLNVSIIFTNLAVAFYLDQRKV